MTEVVSDQRIIISAVESKTEMKIKPQKTIIYKTLVDSSIIHISAERIKTQLFTKFGFMKPKSEEVQVISINKFYETYILASGKYFVDFYRKRTFKLRVDPEVKEVELLKHVFKPKISRTGYRRELTEIEVSGEERLVKESKTLLVVDESGRDVALEKIPSGPSEKNKKRIMKKYGLKEISSDLDLKIIKSKILHSPKQCSRIVSEFLEVSERLVLYVPRFKVKFKNLKTGVEKTAEFDGLTSERIQNSPRINLRAPIFYR